MINCGFHFFLHYAYVYFHLKRPPYDMGCYAHSYFTSGYPHTLPLKKRIQLIVKNYVLEYISIIIYSSTFFNTYSQKILKFILIILIRIYFRISLSDIYTILASKTLFPTVLPWIRFRSIRNESSATVSYTHLDVYKRQHRSFHSSTSTLIFWQPYTLL